MALARGASQAFTGSVEAGTIFISHVEEDANAALRIADGLEEGGYPTWCYERDALPGPSYLLQTARQVEESAAVVLLISANSLGSNQVTAEVVRAHESGRPFVPVLIGLSHVEFAARQPEWREALGSATSIVLPPSGVDAIVPRIRQGLAGLGIGPTDGLQPRDASLLASAVPASTAERTGARRFVPIGVAAAAVVVVLLLAAGLLLTGGGGDDVEVARVDARSKGSAVSTTAVPSTTIAAPAATAPPATSAPSPAAAPAVTAARTPVATAPPAASAPAPTSPPVTSAPATTAPDPPPPGDGTFTTAAGTYEVLDAMLTDEWCPPDDGACLTASGSDRYLVLTLVPADGGPVSSSPAFMAEANQSSVSYSGAGSGQAGAKTVFVDHDVDVVEVVYGMVPDSAAGSSFVLQWPGNGPIPLAVF